MQFRLPRTRNAATALAVISIITSVMWYLLAKSTGVMLYLVPADVLGLQFWQLITFIPATKDPSPVLFGAFIIWSMGGSLEGLWGTRKFLSFSLGVTFTAGLLTVLTAWLAGNSLLERPYFGTNVLSGILWVAYGLTLWSQQLNVFGFSLTGRTFAVFGVLVTALQAVFGGGAAVIPEIFGLALTFLYVRWASPHDLWLRFQSWRLRKQLKNRSSHLEVISGSKSNAPRGSDKYLH